MNNVFFLTLILIIVYNTYKLIYLDQWSKDFYELAEISSKYRVVLLMIVMANLVLSIFLEYFSTEVFTKWWYAERGERRKAEKELEEAAAKSEGSRMPADLERAETAARTEWTRKSLSGEEAW